MKYDFIIVGAGFFGATCARLLTDAGYKCLIIEKESKVGGLCSTTKINNTIIHDYGSHYLHTNDSEVWAFVNKYDTFIERNKNLRIMNENRYYLYPNNLNLLSELYNTTSINEIHKKLEEDRIKYGVSYRRNFEEDCIYKIGFKPYLLTLKGYYEKLYKDSSKNLSIGLTRDLELRNDFSLDFYTEKYVGVPKNGYTALIENMISDDIDIILNRDFVLNKDKYYKLGSCIICTMPIDAFSDYVYGPLSWRSLKIELKKYDTNNILGLSDVLVSDPKNMLLQMVEHKWITSNYNDDNESYLSMIFPEDWSKDKKCFYAVNNQDTENLLDKYIDFVNKNYPNTIFGGRQGLYRNINIDESIRLAIDLSKSIISRHNL